ncbi:AF4/FMR2 family member 3 [Operophtera brumata]|uniref:AF4/FMR2 family member 3 n=1 Tax=Operophtera brumata TaxID=104452 RepID=A0A0L7LTS2_OPEBR|nr:AF4/FMR2 family member 3 [Operophtera brumata]
MYNREVKEYSRIVAEYQQKPACAESASPLSPTPSPAGSVGSVGSGASASSGYCSLVHSVPAHAHQAMLLLNKYFAFLYCGPLSLSSTFRHLVQYVRYAITLLKTSGVPRE